MDNLRFVAFALLMILFLGGCAQQKTGADTTGLAVASASPSAKALVAPSASPAASISGSASVSLREGCYLDLRLKEKKVIDVPRFIPPAVVLEYADHLGIVTPYDMTNITADSSDSTITSSSLDKNITFRNNRLYYISALEITPTTNYAPQINPPRIAGKIFTSNNGTTWLAIKNIDVASPVSGKPISLDFNSTNANFVRLSLSSGQIPHDGFNGGKLEIRLVKTPPPQPPAVEEVSHTEFTLLDANVVFGDYSVFVRPYFADEKMPYTISTFDQAGKKLADYSADTSRFGIAEDFSDQNLSGEIIDYNEGTIETYVPLNNTIIKKIRVDDTGRKTEFTINASPRQCTRTCKIEGEQIDFTKNTCCSGYGAVNQLDGKWICTKCGDGVCSRYETKYSCPSDCRT